MPPGRCPAPSSDLAGVVVGDVVVVGGGGGGGDVGVDVVVDVVADAGVDVVLEVVVLMFVASYAILGPSFRISCDHGLWRHLLGPSRGYLGAILGPSRCHVGPSWVSLAFFGPILGLVGASWGHLGANSGQEGRRAKLTQRKRLLRQASSGVG